MRIKNYLLLCSILNNFPDKCCDTILVFKVSKKIKFVNPLAYSPELNCIEIFQKYIKGNILKNLDCVVENIGKFIKEKLNYSRDLYCLERFVFKFS